MSCFMEDIRRFQEGILREMTLKACWSLGCWRRRVFQEVTESLACFENSRWKFGKRKQPPEKNDSGKLNRKPCTPDSGQWTQLKSSITGFEALGSLSRGPPAEGAVLPTMPLTCKLTVQKWFPGGGGTSGGAHGRGRFGRCRPGPHVSAAASAMLPLLRCVPRALGSAVVGLRAAASSPPLRPLLQPVPRLCIRPFGLLSVRAESARRPSLLRPREPCACGCSELHTEGEFAHVGRGRER